MHKRNLALMTALLAAALAGSFFLFPGLGEIDALRWLYAPAILLTIVFSGDGHAPSVIAAWSSFVACTLLYWGILLVAFAFFWELHLIKQGSRELDSIDLDAAPDDAAAPDRAESRLVRATGSGIPSADAGIPEPGREARRGPDYLETIGRAVADIEGRRRSNFLLQNLDILDLKSDPRLLAAHAIVEAHDQRAVKSLLGRLESRLTKEYGHDEATHAMAQLKQDAREVLRQEGSPVTNAFR